MKMREEKKGLAAQTPGFSLHALPAFSAIISRVALIAVLEHFACCELKSSIVPTLLSAGFAITSSFSFSFMSGASVGAFFGAAAAAAAVVASAWNASTGPGGGAIALLDARGAGVNVRVADGAGSQ